MVSNKTNWLSDIHCSNRESVTPQVYGRGLGFHPSDLTAWARVLHTIQYDFSKVPHCLKWNYSYIDVQCICTPITKNAYMKIWLVLQPGHVWKLWSASALLQPFLSHHIQLFHPDFFWGHNIFHTLLFLYTLPTQFHFQFLNQPCSLVILSTLSHTDTGFFRMPRKRLFSRWKSIIICTTFQWHYSTILSIALICSVKLQDWLISLQDCSWICHPLRCTLCHFNCLVMSHWLYTLDAYSSTYSSQPLLRLPLKITGMMAAYSVCIQAEAFTWVIVQFNITIQIAVQYIKHSAICTRMIH